MNPPGTPARKPSRLKLTLLVVCLAFVLAIALIAWRLLTPPAPFPIPPDLALAYPQAQFDSPDNAWHLYRQAAQLAEQVKQPRDPLQPMDGFSAWQRKDPADWTDEEAAVVHTFVGAFAAPLAVFEQATREPYFVEQAIHQNTDLSHLGQFHILAQWLVARAALAERAGDETAAVGDYATLLRAAVHITHYGPFSSRLTAHALEWGAEVHLWRMIGDGRYRQADTYRRLATALLQTEADAAPLRETYQVEYAVQHDILARIGAEGAKAAQPVSLNPLDPAFDTSSYEFREWFLLATARLRLGASHRQAAAIYRRLIELADHDPLDLIRNPSAQSLLEPHDPLLNLVGFSSSGTLEQELRMQARRRVLAFAAAAQAHRLTHGEFPPSVTALVPVFLPTLPLDPYSGKPLQIRREGDTWVVWSIGPDLLDDLGHKALPLVLHNPGEIGDLVLRVQPPTKR